MRGLLLLIAIGYTSFLAVRFPFVGLMTWEWLSLMSPHRLTFGATVSLPFNLVVALVTITAWLFSREPKLPDNNRTTLLLITFGFVLLISQIFSLDQTYSWPFFDRFARILVFIFVCAAMANSKLRVQSILWIFAISIGFFGVKGGGFTLLSGGGAHVFGPPNSIIRNNNHLGLAVACIIPVIFYLYQTTENILVRRGLIGAGLLSMVAVLGTQSRGAFVALGVMTAILWWRSHHRTAGLIAILIVSFSALMFMPDSWTSRMQTIDELETDGSFQGRVDAWIINTKVALSHPITGAGLRVPYQEHIAHRYADNDLKPRAAHSIYFEILGGTGFIGLFVYLALLYDGYRNSRILCRITRKDPKLEWMHQFGTMSQVFLAAFLVGGLVQSMEMWEGYFLIIVLVRAVRTLAENETRLSSDLGGAEPMGSLNYKSQAPASKSHISHS